MKYRCKIYKVFFIFFKYVQQFQQNAVFFVCSLKLIEALFQSIQCSQGISLPRILKIRFVLFLLLLFLCNSIVSGLNHIEGKFWYKIQNLVRYIFFFNNIISLCSKLQTYLQIKLGVRPNNNNTKNSKSSWKNGNNTNPSYDHSQNLSFAVCCAMCWNQ